MNVYLVFVTPEAHTEIKGLPGNIRQRIRQAIKELADQPFLAQSKRLLYPDADHQLCRLRMDNWRIVYAVSEVENTIDVLAIRKRPPYDYGDLAQLLDELK